MEDFDIERYLENMDAGTENYEGANDPNIETMRQNVYRNFILSREGKTKWNKHLDTSDLRGRVRQLKF